MRFITASVYALFTLFIVCDSYPTGKSTLLEHPVVSSGAYPLTKRSPLPKGTASLPEDLVSQQESNIATQRIFPLTARGVHSRPQRDGQNITINFITKRTLDALNDQEGIEAAAYAKASILLLLDSAADKLSIHLPYNVQFGGHAWYPCSKAVAEENGFSFNIGGIPDCPNMGSGDISGKSAGTATIKCNTQNMSMREVYKGNLVPNQNAPFWNRMEVFADYLRSWKPSTSS
ncbi:hypothetical protein GGU11DRAFT_567205 [Lentinula aff. detonsa]|uniref:Uncharacterized protein n=1 Tax=Lentinula aff. detonsa TaxID=2804958 RepID=A0AA38NCM1_9AGAR|nr:hypothetical protein GGU10DRAFT_357626 [Lentinula aff. detonsa]KAJ3792118.1 hypothetical protein GGU11DRAFT_567205 [Lentinula aff. detonsa]